MEPVRQPQTEQVHTGSLAFTEGESSEVSIELSLGQLRLSAGSYEIGRWDASNVAVSPKSGGVFQMIVDGEAVWFTPHSGPAFGEAINRFISSQPEQGERIEVPRDPSDHSTESVDREPPPDQSDTTLEWLFEHAYETEKVPAELVDTPGQSIGDAHRNRQEEGRSGASGFQDEFIVADDATSDQPAPSIFAPSQIADPPVDPGFGDTGSYGPAADGPAADGPAADGPAADGPAADGPAADDPGSALSPDEVGFDDRQSHEPGFEGAGFEGARPGLAEGPEGKAAQFLIGAEPGTEVPAADEWDPTAPHVNPGDRHLMLPGSSAPIPTGRLASSPVGPPDVEVGAFDGDEMPEDSTDDAVLDEDAQTVVGSPTSAAPPLEEAPDAVEAMELADAVDPGSGVAHLGHEPSRHQGSEPPLDSRADGGSSVGRGSEPTDDTTVHPIGGDRDEDEDDLRADAIAEDTGDVHADPGDDESPSEVAAEHTGRFSGTARGRLARIVAARRPIPEDSESEDEDDQDADELTVADRVLQAQNQMREGVTVSATSIGRKRKMAIGAGILAVVAVLIAGGLAVPALLEGFDPSGVEATTAGTQVGREPTADPDPASGAVGTVGASPAIEDGQVVADPSEVPDTTPGVVVAQPTTTVQTAEPSGSSSQVFGTAATEFVSEWDAVASSISAALRIPTVLVPGRFEFAFTNNISMRGSVTPDATLDAYSIVVDPGGDAPSDELALQALGIAITVADPSTTGSDRRNILADLGLDVTAPDISKLNGSMERNGIRYTLVFDPEAALMTLTVEPSDRPVATTEPS